MNQPQASLNFLGFTLSYHKDMYGQARQYLNTFPSKKAVSRLRERVRQLTSSSCKMALIEAIEEVNLVLRGWGNYFSYGYPRRVFRGVNHFVRCRFRAFLRNRSQRRSKPFRRGESLYAGLKRYGLHYL
jgi:RNA-directed DNA polymerase